MKLNERIWLWFEKYCQNHKISSDVYDLDSMIDSSLSFEENINIIEDDLKSLAEDGTLLKEQINCLKAEQEKEASETNEQFSIDLDLTDSVAVVGDRNSGKTNLAFSFMNNYKGKKKKYLYGYPTEKKGYKRISTWSDLLTLSDSIILIDEIQKYCKLYDRRANTELMELLSFLAQENNTLIFTTQLSQFITKGVEASIQSWCIKQLDILGLKNGCKIKRILRDTAHPRITNKGISIKINEYIAFDLTMPVGFNGLHTFKDQNVKKDWKATVGRVIKTAKKPETKKDHKTATKK